MFLTPWLGALASVFLVHCSVIARTVPGAAATVPEASRTGRMQTMPPGTTDIVKEELEEPEERRHPPFRQNRAHALENRAVDFRSLVKERAKSE